MRRLTLSACEAPLWAPSGHTQTLWAHFLKSPTLQHFGARQAVDLEDGDRLFYFELPGPSNFVVCLFHGLSGDVSSDYMQRTALLCQSLGHTVILVNHRGVGEGAAFAKNPYHSGRAEDASAVLENLKIRYPTKKHIAIGYSMSGNIVLALLGGFRGSVLPDAAITVNAPINLLRGSKLLKTGFNRVYDMRFVAQLRRDIEKKFKLGLISKPYVISPWSTVWDLDQIYTAPAGGFRDREDYYARCSAFAYLKNIKTPTYVLTAADDPFVSVQDYLQADFSKQVQLHIEKCGGHLGYLTRRSTPLGTRRWLDYYLFEALQSLEQTLS